MSIFEWWFSFCFKGFVFVFFSMFGSCLAFVTKLIHKIGAVTTNSYSTWYNNTTRNSPFSTQRKLLLISYSILLFFFNPKLSQRVQIL